ncbi:unnamed protein product [Coregonus sp. 'balchen']|nr:unnamed protein product [Coregonus sp. 'balchen']
MKTILAAYPGVLKGTGCSILSVLQNLPSAPWPALRSKMEKHLQVISVLQWVISFLAMGAAGTVLLIYMFCTDLWVIAAMWQEVLLGEELDHVDLLQRLLPHQGEWKGVDLTFKGILCVCVFVCVNVRVSLGLRVCVQCVLGCEAR